MSLWGQGAKLHLYKNESCMSRERSAYRRSANLQVSTAKQSKTIFCQLNITDSDCVSRKRDGWWVCSNLRPMSHLRFYRAILSHVCATLSRDKVAASATLSHKQTRLLRHLFRFTIFIHKHSSKVMKLFHM